MRHGTETWDSQGSEIALIRGCAATPYYFDDSRTVSEPGARGDSSGSDTLLVEAPIPHFSPFRPFCGS